MNTRKTFGVLTALLFACTVTLFAGAELQMEPLAMAVLGAVLFITSITVPGPKEALMMAISYSTDCDALDLTHTCSDCPDPEGGRVRAIAFIKDDYEFSDPTSYTEWYNAINNGDVIIVPNTRGTFDGGSPVEGPGYGDQSTKYIGTNYSLTYYDENYADNRDFYQNMKRFQNYRVAYKTETKIHMTDKVCQVLPKAPIAVDTASQVVWEVMVKWSSDSEPTPYTAPDGIFICFVVS